MKTFQIFNQVLLSLVLVMVAFVLGTGIRNAYVKAHENDPRTISVSESDVTNSAVLVSGSADSATKVVVFSGDRCPACIAQEPIIEDAAKASGAALYVAEMDSHGSKADGLTELAFAHSPQFGELHRAVMRVDDPSKGSDFKWIDAHSKTPDWIKTRGKSLCGSPAQRLNLSGGDGKWHPVCDPQKVWDGMQALAMKAGVHSTPTCLVFNHGKATLCQVKDLDSVLKS